MAYPQAVLTMPGGGTQMVDIIDGRGYLNGQRITELYPGIQWNQTAQPGSGGAYGHYTLPQVANAISPTPTQQQPQRALFPYESALQNALNRAPSYQPRSQSDLSGMASMWSDMQINPQLEALQAQADARIRQLNAQRAQVEANYSNVPDTATRLMDDARKKAIQLALQRGGGFSGAVEWENEKLSQPVMEWANKTEAQKTADLNAIADAIMGVQDSVSSGIQNLEAQRGTLGSSRLNDLTMYDEGRAFDNWNSSTNLLYNMANLGAGQYNQNMNFAQAMLPYTNLTEAQRQGLPLDWAQTMGQVPSSGVAPSGGAVPLRQYITQKYGGGAGQIDWDANTGNVIINGRAWTPAQLTAMGGKLVDGSWHLPESVVNRLAS